MPERHRDRLNEYWTYRSRECKHNFGDAAFPARPRRDTRRNTIHVNTHFAYSLLLAAAVASAPLAASAADTVAPVALAPASTAAANPIRLDSVYYSPSLGVFQDWNYSGLVTASFTNTDASPAVDVVFTLHGYKDRIIDTFDDAGSYTQGLSIRRTYRTSAADPNQRLEVEQATFADGTVWNKPTGLAVTSRRQAH
jgi:hypothetical protein